MKKFILILIFLNFVNAKIVDRVVAVVNGEPITSYDITKTFKSLNISPREALNILIEQKIIENEIKRRGIEVDDFDIENAIEKIAKQNGMSVFEFKNYLKERGEYNNFLKNLKKDIQKQKLFAQIVNSKLKVSNKELKNFYDQNKEKFTTFKQIEVIEYISQNPDELKHIKKNPLYNSSNIKIENRVFKYNQIPLNLMFLFNSTKEGEFTPIINNGNSYVMFYINKKEGKVILPFEQIKNIIANQLMQQKRNAILKEYFNTLKNQADIEIFK